jgi:hypothetical protein
MRKLSLKVKFSLCLTNYTLCHEGVWGKGMECGTLNVSQPYGPSWTVTGIALLFYKLSPSVKILKYSHKKI